jgi:hypothetical protein
VAVPPMGSRPQRLGEVEVRLVEEEEVKQLRGRQCRGDRANYLTMRITPHARLFVRRRKCVEDLGPRVLLGGTMDRTARRMNRSELLERRGSEVVQQAM